MRAPLRSSYGQLWIRVRRSRSYRDLELSEPGLEDDVLGVQPRLEVVDGAGQIEGPGGSIADGQEQVGAAKPVGKVNRVVGLPDVALFDRIAPQRALLA